MLLNSPVSFAFFYAATRNFRITYVAYIYVGQCCCNLSTAEINGVFFSLFLWDLAPWLAKRGHLVPVYRLIEQKKAYKESYQSCCLFAWGSGKLKVQLPAQLSSWDLTLFQISSGWVEQAYHVEFRIVSRALDTRKWEHHSPLFHIHIPFLLYEKWSGPSGPSSGQVEMISVRATI